MRPDRKDEIVACCNAIIRNAEKIVDDYGYDNELHICIDFDLRETPTITIKKKIIPEELVELWSID